MATKELRELRHQYKAAYTSYMHCVHILADAGERGVWPPTDLLKLEEQTLNDLTSCREALLVALRAHTHKQNGG